MAEVFISYASSNRERILAILAELQARGIDCWLDKHKIPGASNWSQEIARAIQSCRLFILMASTESLKSEYVGKEVHVAVNQKKPILPLWLEENLTYPDNLVLDLIEKQHIVATGEFSTWEANLFATLQLAAVTIRGTAGTPVTPRAAIKVKTPVLPYLANRLEQERRLFRELERHIAEQAQRPIAFIIQGDRESQCLDGFVDRLCKYTLPRHLSRLNFTDILEWKYICWPTPVPSPSADTADERAATYRVDVSTALDLPASANMQAIARQIMNLHQPVSFCSTIYGEHWQLDELGLIRRVLEFWSQLPDLSSTQLVVIFLVIAHQRPVDTLLSRWFGRPVASNIPAISVLLEDVKDVSLDIVPLPELADVTVPDVEHWVREIVRPHDPEAMIRQIKEGFRQQRIAFDRAISMEKLVPLLKAVLPASDQLRGA